MAYTRPLFLALAIACGMAMSAVRAADDDGIDPDRPGFTSSSTVVGKGRLQLETSIQWERQRDDELHTRTLSTPTLLRIGLSPSFELRAETEGRSVVHASDPASGEHWTTAGYADTSAGFKWRLAGQQGGHPALALQGELLLPSGSGELRGKGARPALFVPASWELGHGLQLEFMPGIGTDSDDRGARYRYGFLAANLDKEFDERLHGFVELAAPQIARADHGGTQALVDAGLTWQLGKDCQLDAALAHGLNRRTADVSLAFGVSIRR